MGELREMVAKELHRLYAPKLDGMPIFEPDAYLPDADSILTLLRKHQALNPYQKVDGIYNATEWMRFSTWNEIARSISGAP